jgi:hypothetical protein
MGSGDVYYVFLLPSALLKGFESQKQKYVFAVDYILMQGYFGSSGSPCYYLIRCSASI